MKTAAQEPYDRPIDADRQTWRATNLCMKGKLRCKNRCRSCGGTFAYNAEDEILECPCGRQPRGGIYIDLHDPSIPTPDHRLKVYADKKGIPFDSARHASRTLEAIRLAFDEHTFQASDYRARAQAEFLFENYAERWLKVQEGRIGDGEGDIKASTYKAKASRLRNLLIPALKGADIRDVKGLKLEEAALALRTDPGGKHRAGNTRAGALAELKQILQDAHRWGDIETMPAFPGFAMEIPEHSIPSLSTREKVFCEVPARHQPIFWMVRYHPMRHCEAARLRPGDVDLVADLITLSRRRRKRGETYQLPLHPIAKLKLLEYLAGPIVPHPDQPLFQHLSPKTGKIEPYREYTMNAVWKQACKKANVSGYTFNESTRHAIATDAVNRGVDIGAVSAALGHSSVSTTARFYAHYKPEALNAVLNIPAPADRPQTGPNPRKASRKAR